MIGWFIRTIRGATGNSSQSGPVGARLEVALRLRQDITPSDTLNTMFFQILVLYYNPVQNLCTNIIE